MLFFLCCALKRTRIKDSKVGIKDMNSLQAKSAIAVQNVLNDFGLSCKVVELSSSTRTALDAANSIGCKVAQIAKSLIFKTERDEPVLVLASGPNRVDENKIAELVGCKILKADADFVRNTTGFAIGGIPPVGHKNKMGLIFVDDSLLNYDESLGCCRNSKLCV